MSSTRTMLYRGHGKSHNRRSYGKNKWIKKRDPVWSWVGNQLQTALQCTPSWYKHVEIWILYGVRHETFLQAVFGQYDHERRCLESCGLLLKTSSSQLSPQTLFLPHHISKSYTPFKSSSISIFLRKLPGSLQSMWYQCSSLCPEHWQFMKFYWSFLALLVSFFIDVVLISSSPWLISPGLGL